MSEETKSELLKKHRPLPAWALILWTGSKQVLKENLDHNPQEGLQSLKL